MVLPRILAKPPTITNDFGGAGGSSSDAFLGTRCRFLWLAGDAVGPEMAAAGESSGRGGSMTLGGWIIMTVSVGFVTGLLIWSLWKVLSTPGSTQHLHSQIDIRTPDVNED